MRPVSRRRTRLSNKLEMRAVAAEAEPAEPAIAPPARAASKSIFTLMERAGSVRRRNPDSAALRLAADTAVINVLVIDR